MSSNILNLVMVFFVLVMSNVSSASSSDSTSHEKSSFEEDQKEAPRFYTGFGWFASKVVGERLVKYVGAKLQYEYDDAGVPVGLTQQDWACLARLKQEGLLSECDDDAECDECDECDEIAEAEKTLLLPPPSLKDLPPLPEHLAKQMDSSKAPAMLPPPDPITLPPPRF